MKHITENPTLQRIIMAAALVVIIAIGLIPIIPMKTTPASAPSNKFSAERAMQDLQVVAAQPHPMGSAAQVLVTEYLLKKIEEAGALVETQASNNLVNILVTIPGNASTGTILVTGHYDAHAGAPGAGDDGVSTLAMLEAIRVLQSSEKLQNDIIFLFSDGEEAGSLGSTAFMMSPLSDQVDLVLAFDAWPGHGPTTLQQTSQGDGWLVRNLAKANPRVFAMSYGVNKERAGVDSDFDMLSTRLPGIEFENNGTGTRYHTPYDTVDGVDPSLVQSQGEAMLKLVRYFGSLDLSKVAQEKDYSFFTWPIVGIVAYPYWINMLLSVVAIVAIMVTIILGWLKGRKIKPLPTIIGAIVYAVLLYGLVMISKALWDRVLAANPATTGVAFQDFYGSGWAILGFLLVTGIIFVVLMSLLARYTRVPSLTAGTLIAWLAFGFYLFGPAAFDFGSPLMIEFTAWSLLAGAGGLAVVTFTGAPLKKLVLLIVCAIPVIFIFAPLIELSMLKPVDGAMAPVLMLIYAMGLLLPQILFVTGQGQPTTTNG